MEIFSHRIVVIIPCNNEEKSISKVIDDIPKELVSLQNIIVVDNKSSDSTFETAHKKGVTVLKELNKGYGFACLKGIVYANSLNPKPDIFVFLDGDYSDFPSQMNRLITPIINEKYDFVIGSRALGEREKYSMTPQQIFGNWLAVTLIKWLFNYKYTDLGPFRAITESALNKLEMNDKTYGWTVEMQLKAIKHRLKITEVAVDYKKRIGTSKVSGTLKGTLLAGYKIITWILKYK